MSPHQMSVTMAVRNVERFLVEAIESVLGQTYSDFEFVIVDFGSTDRSKEILRDYAAKDARINIHEAPNLKLVEARNKAFELSTGSLIAVMDADDVCVPERLEWEVQFLEANPEGWSSGGGDRVDRRSG